MYCVLLWSTVIILFYLLDMLGINFVLNLFLGEGCTFFYYYILSYFMRHDCANKQFIIIIITKERILNHTIKHAFIIGLGLYYGMIFRTIEQCHITLSRFFIYPSVFCFWPKGILKDPVSKTRTLLGLLI